MKQSVRAAVMLVTLTAMARVVTYTAAYCPSCSRRVMSVPGKPIVEVRAIASESGLSGRGRVVGCKRCSQLCEVIEHA